MQHFSSASRIIGSGTETYCLVDVWLHGVVKGQLAVELFEILTGVLPLLSCVVWNDEVLLHVLRELTAGVAVRVEHCG